MSITGKVIHVFETNKITETFSKRDIIIDDSDNPTYPNPLKIEFHKDKCSLLDSIKVGQSVTIEVNHRGREWVNPKGEKVYFNSINGWKISTSEQPHDITPEHSRNETTWIEDAKGNSDPLPF